MTEKKTKTRFAPSPTGSLHVGNYRTALFSYLYARQQGGEFALRIEDTDKERSEKKFEESIFRSLEWLGIDADETVRQSERSEFHRACVEKLIENGFVYLSDKEEGGRAAVFRFKNPNTQVTFTDLIRGEITFDTTDLGDFVVAKSKDEPVYHMAVVADDVEMGVTHIIRGDDHISNTARQILIQEALGAKRPVYAHIPLVMTPDRKKLSKRHGAKGVLEYRDQGVLSSALVNYLALLGWNPGTDQEIFSFGELIESFDLSRVQKGGAIFDETKLRWINSEHLKYLPQRDILEEITKYVLESQRVKDKGWDVTSVIKNLLPVIQERIEFLEDARILFDNGEFDFVFEEPHIAEPKDIIWKKQRDGVEGKDITQVHLKHVQELVQALPEDFEADTLKKIVWPYAEERGRGDVLWPVRYALTGKEKSPDPFVVAEILGKEEVLKRLESAYRVLE